MVKIQGHFSPGEIAIEIDGPQNNNVVNFTPFHAKLRGRWDPKRVKIESDPDRRPGTLPDTPGMMVCIDLKKRSARAIDPLAWPENEDIVEQWTEALNNRLGSGIGKTQAGSVKEIVLKNQTIHELKTILWQMWQLVDSGLARCITDNMPTANEILALDGNIIRVATGAILDYQPDGKTRRGRFLESDEIDAIRERVEARERVAAE